MSSISAWWTRRAGYGLVALTVAAAMAAGCSDGGGTTGEQSAQGPGGGAGSAGATTAGSGGEAGGEVSGSSGQGGEAGPGGSSGAAGEAGASGSSGQAGAGGTTAGAAGTGGAQTGGGAGTGALGVVCGVELPGPPLESGLVEDNPQYEAQAAKVDTSVVPDTVDLSKEGTIQRAVVGYMLGKPGAILSFVKADATGPLGEAVLIALAASKGQKLDFQRLRQGLYNRYACDRGFPATLAKFKETYGDYTTWDSQTLDSAPKCTQRRIFRNEDQTLSVAETLEGDTVRETEVLRSGRADGALDFAVYTHDGELSNRSSFATNGGDELIASAPYTCMSCHLNPSTFVYDDPFPTGTGVCAQ